MLDFKAQQLKRRNKSELASPVRKEVIQSAVPKKQIDLCGSIHKAESCSTFRPGGLAFIPGSLQNL